MFFGIVENEASDINLDESLDPFIIEFENFSKLSDSFFLLQENGLLLNEDGLIVKFFEAIASIWVKFTRWFADTMQALFNFLFNASEKTTEQIKKNGKKAKEIADNLSNNNSGDSEKKEKKSETIKRLQSEIGDKDKEIEKLNKQLQDEKNANTTNSSEIQKLKNSIDELEKQKRETERKLDTMERDKDYSSRFADDITNQIKPFSALISQKVEETYEKNRIIKLKDDVISSELNDFKRANNISANISTSKVNEFIDKIDKSISENRLSNSAKDLKEKNKTEPLDKDTNYSRYYEAYKELSGEDNSKTNEDKTKGENEFRDKYTEQDLLEVERIQKSPSNVFKIAMTLSRDVQSFVTNAEKIEYFIKDYIADNKRIKDIEKSNDKLNEVIKKVETAQTNNTELRTWLTQQLRGYINYFKVYAKANRNISKYIKNIKDDNQKRQKTLLHLLEHVENTGTLPTSDSKPSNGNGSKSGGRNNK